MANILIDRRKLHRLIQNRDISHQELADKSRICLRSITDWSRPVDENDGEVEKGIQRETFSKLLPALNALLTEAGHSPVSHQDLKPGPRVWLDNLPRSPAPMLFQGRALELNLLHQAWEKGDPQVVQLYGFGGIGKSMVVRRFLDELQQKCYPGCEQIFAWSFCELGREPPATDVHDFLAPEGVPDPHAEGEREPPATDVHDFLGQAHKHFSALLFRELSEEERRDDVRYGEGVARMFLEVGGVLILDSVESVQTHPSSGDGVVKNPGVRALLNVIRSAPPPGRGQGPKRLLVLTTRWGLADFVTNHVLKFRTCPLGPLSPEDGATLLRKARLPGDPDRTLNYSLAADNPQAFENELKRTADEYKGHPLSLLLLASYLLRSCGGDLARRPEEPPLPPKAGESAYTQVHRILEAYSELFMQEQSELGQACKKILFLLGLFNQPAPIELIAVLRRKPTIDGLTEKVCETGLYDSAVSELRRLLFLTPASEGGEVLAIHPLVREYFGRQLRDRFTRSWADAHKRLFAHLCERVVEECPTDNADLQRLIHAVIHGCKAGLYQEAFRAYSDRIQRGPEMFAARQGLLGPLLAALSCFFKGGEWGIFSEDAKGALDDRSRAFVLLQAGGYHQVTSGYAAQAAEDCFREADTLCKQACLQEERFLALLGRWRWALAHGLIADSGQHAARLADLAKNLKQGFSLTAASTQAGSAFFAGNFEQARKHAEKGVSGGGPSQPAANGQLFLGEPIQVAEANIWLFLNEPRLTCRAFLAVALWHEGEVSRALKLGEELVQLAEELAHLHNLVIARWFNTFLQQFCGDVEGARINARQVLERTVEQKTLVFLAGAHCHNGWVKAQGGAASNNRAQIQEGLADIQYGLETWRANEARFVTPYWRSLQADAHAKLEEYPQALKCLNEGIQVAEDSKETWWLAELYHAKGKLLHRQGDKDNPAQWFRKAIDQARQQGSLALELRAATSLCTHNPREPAIVEMLLSVYQRQLAKDPTAPDLRKAREVLPKSGLA